MWYDGAIQNEGRVWLPFEAMMAEVDRVVFENKGIRFWQLWYNLAYEMQQDGLPATWQELFYEKTFHKGLAEFYTKFDVEDGFIVPKEDPDGSNVRVPVPAS